MHNLKLSDMPVEELDKLVQDLKHIVVSGNGDNDVKILLDDAVKIRRAKRDDDLETLLAVTISMEIDNDIIKKLINVSEGREP